jgi:hypothetical protein
VPDLEIGIPQRIQDCSYSDVRVQPCVEYQDVDVREEALFSTSVAAHGRNGDSPWQICDELRDPAIERFREDATYIATSVTDRLGNDRAPQLQKRLQS